MRAATMGKHERKKRSVMAPVLVIGTEAKTESGPQTALQTIGFDESPTGYSLASCSPAEIASASPADDASSETANAQAISFICAFSHGQHANQVLY